MRQLYGCAYCGTPVAVCCSAIPSIGCVGGCKVVDGIIRIHLPAERYKRQSVVEQELANATGVPVNGHQPEPPTPIWKPRKLTTEELEERARDRARESEYRAKHPTKPRAVEDAEQEEREKRRPKHDALDTSPAWVPMPRVECVPIWEFDERRYPAQDAAVIRAWRARLRRQAHRDAATR